MEVRVESESLVVSRDNLVKKSADVRPLFLLDYLQVLVVVGIAELHKLEHDSLLWVLQLLVNLLRVSNLLLVDHHRVLSGNDWSGLWLRLGQRRRHMDLWRRLRSCSSTCTSTATVVALLELGLDLHQAVQLALVLELVDDCRVLLKVVVTEVFHQEECLAHLPVGRILVVPCGWECML